MSDVERAKRSDTKPAPKAQPSGELHQAYLAPLLVAAYLGLRIVIVSGFDTTTARAVVSAADPLTLALALVIDVIRAAACLPFLACLHWASHRPTSEHVWIAVTSTVVALTLAAAVVTVAQLTALLVFGLLVVLSAVVDRAQRLDKEHVTTQIARRVAVVAVAVVPLLLALVSPTVWLPPETIEVRQQATFTGYVLNEDDRELLVLREDDRAVLRVGRTSLRERQLCELGVSRHRSLLGVLTKTQPDDSRYPPCP